VATILGAIPWNFALAYAGLKLGENYTNVEHTLGRFSVPAAIVVLVLLGVAYYVGKRMSVEEKVLERVTGAGD
jgi:membrane protein DedA with SNARE-associated domain